MQELVLIILAASCLLTGSPELSPATGSVAHLAADEMIQLMPKPTDHTSMWWRNGFAGVIKEAPWRRYTRTGNYWFLFDTDKIAIPRLGSVESALGKIGGADLSLKIEANGKVFRCEKGVDWSKYAGPRLVESGRFLQRTDVNGLVFTAEDGTKLNVEARVETVAWPDQLGLTLAARPGLRAFEPGEESGGRVKGGYGFTGENVFRIPAQQCHVPGDFTLSFWVFATDDFVASKHGPWLVCKNKHESAPGNFGITFQKRGLAPEVRMNLTSNGERRVHRSKSSKELRVNQWNHLSMSYQGNKLLLYVNGVLSVDEEVKGERSDLPGSLTFGGRDDGATGYFFRGAIDEVTLFKRALKLAEIKKLHRQPERDVRNLRPFKSWSFDSNVPAISGLARDAWENAALEIELAQNNPLQARWEAPPERAWNSQKWEQAHLMINPITMEQIQSRPSKVKVQAVEKVTNIARDVTYEPDTGWHRINLDKVVPQLPGKQTAPSNDALERVKIMLSNHTDQEQVIRLMFEKTSGGIKQKIGQPITGISAILRDAHGNPTGIPVQLSKNWHNDVKGGVYSGQWFHGISQIRMPPRASTELELSIAYGHWGGLPAASHAQLSLIGYGSNQLWDQSALGAWGESICYSPEQVLGGSTVTDVRPLMVRGMSRGQKWSWTSNVGGADILRLVDSDGQKSFASQLQTQYQRTGPCLTEVHYKGSVGKTGIKTRVTVSLSRTDDIVRATYRIRMQATKEVEFKRFVLFQTGADSYTFSRDHKLAFGNSNGLGREWEANPGGDAYRGKPIELTGDNPWVSLHESTGRKPDAKFWANRGFVIRSWNAKLGGEKAGPWVTERGNQTGGGAATTMDLLPPPNVTQLLPGDFVDATLEFLVVPQSANEYYGPNEALKAALKKHQNTWKMIQREASGGALNIVPKFGKIERLYPGVMVATENGRAEFEIRGGLGFIPLTFSGLKKHFGYHVLVNGKKLDQSQHGNDFWQTDFDPETKTWQQTYNIPTHGDESVNVVFEPN